LGGVILRHEFVSVDFGANQQVVAFFPLSFDRKQISFEIEKRSENFVGYAYRPSDRFTFLSGISRGLSMKAHRECL
jgi:hypothetical protein